MPGGHSHRAGSLRQSNKRNKRNKSSKRSVNRKQGGKIAGGGRTGPKSQQASQAKANRRHVAKQRRDAKKDKLLEARRNLGRVGSMSGASGDIVAGAPVPRVVGIISLSENEMELEKTVQNFITSGADSTHNGGIDAALPSCVTAKFATHKRDGNLTVLTSSGCFRPQYASKDIDDDASDANEGKRQDASINAALDLCRVCDLVIFAVDGTDPTKAIGTTIVDNGPTGMSIGGTDGTNDAPSVTTHTTSGANKFDLDDLVSQRGDRILAACKAQGLPTPLTLLVNREASEEEEEEEMMSLATTLKTARRHALRRRNELKRYVSRLATTEFGEDARVTEIDVPAHFGGDGQEDNMMMDDDEAEKPTFLTKSKKILPDAATAATSATLFPTRTALIRTLCTISAAPPKWVSEVPRPYIMADGGVQYNAADQTLQITGYTRGMAPLNVHNLVHLPNVGTYAVKSVEDANAKAPFYRAARKSANDDDQQAAVVEADPMKRESLDRFASPDALDGEQNLIGFDEHDDYFDGDSDEEEDKNATTAADGTFKQSADARPAGWSDYQAAWLDALDDDEDAARDHGELAFALNKKETASVAGGIDVDMDEANDVTPEERQALLERRRKDQKEDLEFPDEVEVDEDEKASERFARYRSLKSFRKSFWDPKENLPDTYGPIYHFSSFRATQGDVMADAKDIVEAAASCGRRWWSEDGNAQSDAMEDEDENEDKELLEGCVPSGAYITITLEEVPQEAVNRLSPNAVATAVSLLPHENKVSVVHMALSQMTKCEQPDDMPIKSKDILTFRCGWRTWQSRPIFSQNNLNSDKHKFERYLPTGGAFFAGTVFGPVTYGPCPVLAFREANNDVSGGSDRRQLVAVGSTLGADAERIVVKRIVLTGYPVRVHKRHATVKYMFYNPEDVKWFKPAGLVTKHGLQGNIIESVGEHGTMKCLFNAPIKQHDTVCLPLYKRVYPKYAPVNDEDLLIL